MCKKCNKYIATKKYQENPHTFVCPEKIVDKLPEQEMNDWTFNMTMFGIKLQAKKPYFTNIDTTS